MLLNGTDETVARFQEKLLHEEGQQGAKIGVEWA
jgi:hypothetical protein